MSGLPSRSVPVVLLALCLCLPCNPGAQAAPEPPAPDAQPVQEITVTASKYDKSTLEHVIVPHFVESHMVPSSGVGQIARWQMRVCPSATGLGPAFNEAVARRIESTARTVGARMAGPKCKANIEVLFTSTPQALLDDIEKHNPWALGSARKPNDTRVTRAVQGWYYTGTRLLAPPPGTAAASLIPGEPGLVPDPPYGNNAREGDGSEGRLGSGVRSELVHVLVIVDVQQVLSVPLDAIADYIAMISLTRVAPVDTCNELPSILDLLSAGCGGRARPTGLTQADAAFLKALYSSPLDKKLNVEEGEMRTRMVELLGTP